MNNSEISEFDDYSNSLQLFKNVYLYDGYKKDISKYASLYFGSGEHDVVRTDSYSNCIQYDENGRATWKIISPKNIFGIELEHIVNHKNHNEVTSNLILNGGRFDLNRLMVRFAQIDVTKMSEQEILDLVENILSKNNEQIITEYGIKENPNGILINSIIADSVLSNLKSKENTEFPDIKCDCNDGSILLKSEQYDITINNNLVKFGDQYIKYNIVKPFPECSIEIDGIKGNDSLLSSVSQKLTEMNNRNSNIENEILGYALEKAKLEKEKVAVKALYQDYLQKQEKLDRSESRYD